MGRQFRRTESAPTQPNKLGRVPSTKFKPNKPLVRKRSLKAYLVVLIFSMGCWFRPEDPQLLVQTIAETSSFDELMANLSLTDVLSTEYVLGASYYSLWTKLNEAMSAAVLHFQDAPNVPVYRLLPLLKLQFEYIAKHRMDKHTLKREYAMFGARHTKVEKLDQFADMIGFSEAVYDGELVIRNFLDTTGYELLQYEPAVSYEKPSYFIAYHPLRQHAIVSIKGTSSVSDLLTDVLHTPVPFLRDSWVHSGMLNAARFLVNRTESLIKNIFAPLDYRVTFTGHSLGAGTAQLATLIYRWERNWTGIDCIAVAPPPTLNKQATNYTKDIIWSLVAGDDIFPRWNFGLISANARILADLDAEMQESGKSLDEFYEEFDYLTMTQEYRKTIEEVASSKGAHIDMHVSGEITYVTRTTE
ncbi:Sn1-specific diacylglycerol lipase alpha, partial [Hondaea fermentalgiana]